MSTSTSVQTARCPKCRNNLIPVIEPHQGGATISCRTCGHSQETDHNGQPYTPPAGVSDFQANDTVHYPTGLACTSISLLKHNEAVRTHKGYITGEHTGEIAFRLYHQPYRRPVITFRTVKHRNTDDNVRYVYAAEMLPFDETIIQQGSREARALRNLLLQESSKTTGIKIQAATGNWPICPPGTILKAPLSPYQ